MRIIAFVTTLLIVIAVITSANAAAASLSQTLTATKLAATGSPSVAQAQTPATKPAPEPYSVRHGLYIAILALVLYFVVAAWISGHPNPLMLVVGADGRLSTSKFQFFLWTGVTVFCYAWLFAARAFNGSFDAIDDLPAHLLTAMGFSVVTAAGAKAITVSYQAAGRIQKAVATTPTGLDVGSLVANDAGIPDITKIQMLTWTFIAAGVYFSQVFHLVDGYATCSIGTACHFPDIDGALMVLMGLGQGAYLGSKLSANS